MKDLLAAERRARALLFAAKAGPGASFLFDITDDADGWALLAACRAAPCLAATATARLNEPSAPSGVWRALIPGCRRFSRLAEGKPRRSLARMVSPADAEQELPVPDDGAAWAIPLGSSAPRVRPDDGLGRALSCAESREIDRVAIEEYGVPGLCLMENAAAGAVTAAVDMLGSAAARGVLVVAGGGNNGGDGLAMARGFQTLGVPVEVALMKPSRVLTGDALINHQLLEEAGISCRELARQPEFLESMAAGKALVVDALLGTGFKGNLSPAYFEAVERMNAAEAPLLAVDIPSGLDGDTGAAAETAVRAARTITFAAVKKGLREKAAARYVGELFIGDIGFQAG